MLRGDGGDAGGCRFVVKAVGHGGHVQPGGQDGVGHGCWQPLEEEALNQDSFYLVFWKQGSHVLQQLRWAAVTESGMIQEEISLLPLGFTVVFAEVLLESLVGVLVLEVDGQQEGAAGE